MFYNARNLTFKTYHYNKSLTKATQRKKNPKESNFLTEHKKW